MVKGRNDGDDRTFLAELYGVEFPESLFQFHEFVAGLTAKERRGYFGGCFSALRMSPGGPLEVLALPRTRRAKLQPALSMLLHWRFYRDPPEFFSCLYGGTDALHWGLLLDDPARGFRGAASFYHSDGDCIEEYHGLFDAVLQQAEENIEGNDELIEDDPDEEAHYRCEQEVLSSFLERLRAFMRAKGIRRNERRGAGISTDTGLDLIVPGKPTSRPPSVFAPNGDTLREPEVIENLVAQALIKCEKGDPIPALGLGRSLWYWGGTKYSNDGYRLMRRAYEVLERPTLVKVLDLHHRHRDLPSVDLLRK
ncbi:MAG TPA: ADP-ribosylation family protein [Gemmataceae bacterium]|nr:ADP-ribosylation family protein [Gemmataceae bacterium]